MVSGLDACVAHVCVCVACAGKHTAKATVLPDGAIRVDIEWGQPHAGSGHDEFR